MFRKALVATDLTPASAALLSCVGQLKPLGLEEVVLVHVIYVAHTVGLAEQLADEAAPQLERQAAALAAQGIAVRTTMPVGVPAYALANLADEEEVSVVVIGSHGRSLLHGLLAGSVALGLLGITITPVLLVRMAIAAAEQEERCQLACERFFGKVLFPTDFSETAERAFHYLQHVVKSTGAQVTLLHVQDTARLAPHLTARLEEFNQIDQERLERMAARLREQGAASVSTTVKAGAPLTTILAEAGAPGYTSIVMGSQGRGFVAEITLGSVANGVARRAPLPVLFVPAPR